MTFALKVVPPDADISWRDSVASEVEMASVYPGQVDTTATFPPDSTLEDQTFDDIDGQGTDHTTWMGNVGDAVIKIETELGADPSGSLTTVADRIGSKADLAQVVRSDATTTVTSNAPDLERFISNPIQIFRRSNGTPEAPASLASGDTLGSIFWAGRGATGYPGFLNHAAIGAQAAGPFSNTSTPTRLIFSTTPTNEVAASERMRITEKGLVGLYGKTNVSQAVIDIGTGTGTMNLIGAADQGAPSGIFWKQDAATVADGATQMPRGISANLRIPPGAPEVFGIGVVSRVDEFFEGGTWAAGKGRVALWGQTFVHSASALRYWGMNLECSLQSTGTGFSGNLTGAEIGVATDVAGDHTAQCLHLVHLGGSGNGNFALNIDGSTVAGDGRLKHFICAGSAAAPTDSFIWYGPKTLGVPSGTPLFQVSPIGSVFMAGRLVLNSTANGYVQFPEKTSAPGGAANVARLYARDSGGTTQLVVQLPDGTIKVLAP